MLDPAVYYKALQTHDERFDGRVFVGVVTTGIYCRPVCPAGPPKFENCRFYPSAAAAREAGFRPCLRCRPEIAPDLFPGRGTSNTVSRGLELISRGDLDGDDATVDALAERLGVGARQLRRLFMKHLGASPVTVAQTRRVHFAKQLIHDTRLPMSEIALAAGFGSVRRFNEVFRQLFKCPPSALRSSRISALPEGSAAVTGVTVRLTYKPPYDWQAILSHLDARAVEGVERVRDGSYFRTIEHDGETGTVEVSHVPETRSLRATIRFPAVRALPSIVNRIRRVFDLGADVTMIGKHLARDPMLAPLISKRPGLRTPGAWDGFELAVRAVLGQQISVGAARRLAGQLVVACGTPMTADPRSDASLTSTFPRADQLTAATVAALGMPRARQLALETLAHATLADPHLFEPLETVEKTVSRLCALRGVGDWTAHYIALRAAREPDAFPSSDVGLLRSVANRDGARMSPAELCARAECWRPWRSYAAQHLWTADA